jgi:hypothetical protein
MQVVRWLRDRRAGAARWRRLAAGALVCVPDLAWLGGLRA